MPAPLTPSKIRISACALLLLCAGTGWRDAAHAQASTAVPPLGIPLGSTEIATPGISPTQPLANTATSGATGCSSTSTAPEALFDGGGLSSGGSLRCSPQQSNSVLFPPTTGTARAGIPLGSTELNPTGLSPAPSSTRQQP